MNDFGPMMTILSRVAAAAIIVTCGSACRGRAGAGSAVDPPPEVATSRSVDEPRRSALGGAMPVPADGRAALVVLPESTSKPAVTVQVSQSPPVSEPVWTLTPERAPRATGVQARMQAWLGQPIAWAARPNGTPAPDSAAMPSVPGVQVVTLPARSGVSAAPIKINDRPLPVRWLAPLSGTFDFAAPSERPPASNPWLLAALEPARSQPWSLWRARLASPGLGPIGAAPVRGDSTGSARDSIVTRLGEQHASVWSVAIQRLAAADRDVARRLAIRLGGAVNFGDGVWAPVWPAWPGPASADDGLALLREDLLSDDLPTRDRAARAAAWIDTLPTGAAWVIDDAGESDSVTGSAIATLALANLTDQPAAASVAAIGDRGESEGAPLEMLTIGPMSVARVRVNAGADRQRDQPARALEGEGRLVVRVGTWRGQVSVLNRPVAARPPGVRIGPLVRDLDMGQIVAAAESAGAVSVRLPAADRVTVAVLQRDATASGRSRWVLYAECSRPGPADTASSADSLVVALGQTGGGFVWRVKADGNVEVIRGGKPEGGAGPTVRVGDLDGRWRCWLPIPESAIEQNRWLRIALTREIVSSDGELERTSWPRPVEPWEETAAAPARVLIDLSTWGE